MSVKISIVMPVYNSGRVLETAIESVLLQTYTNYELIIIDGGSTDNTKEIVKKYKDQIKIFVSEKDKGYADALNKGIKRATGDYYIMLAADDYLLSGALKDFSDELAEETDVWCGNMYCIKEANMMTRFARVNDVKKIKYGKVLAHPACFFKIKSFDTFGYYDIDLPVNSDREILLRWFDKGAKFQLSDKYITVFSCKGMSTKVADERNIAKITDGEKVSIKYGLDSQKAHNLLKKDYKRRKIGRVIKKLFADNYSVMYFIYLVDGQHPLKKRKIRQLNIAERYFSSQ